MLHCVVTIKVNELMRKNDFTYSQIICERRRDNKLKKPCLVNKLLY